MNLMWEETGTAMEKRSFVRQPAPPKAGSSADGKKTDKYRRFPRQVQRDSRDCGNQFVQQQGLDNAVRRPVPQKSKSAGDKRPSARKNYCSRQREEVADYVTGEVGSLNNQSKKSLAHLLNFTYADRGSSGGGFTHWHKSHFHASKSKYSKEQFLQANCQFVVKDIGDYTVHTADPDRLVLWDLVEEVRTTGYETPSCPICLHPPLAGKITRCGHIYCWSCILHYLSLVEKGNQKCPICYNYIKASDLRSVQTDVKIQNKVGDLITMKLMKRGRGSTYAVPVQQWQFTEGKPQRMIEELNREYAKVLVASADEILQHVVSKERATLIQQLKDAEDSEICFIESALALLEERDKLLTLGKDVQQIAENSDSESLRYLQSSDTSQEANFLEMSFGGLKEVKYYASAFSDESETEHDHFARSRSESNVFSDDGSLTGAESGALSNSSDLAHLEGDFELSVPFTPPDGTESRGSSVGSPEFPAACDQALSGQLGITTRANQASSVVKDNFYFFQAADGQYIYLQSVNARCLASEYGSLENCPDTITATIVELESNFMTEEIRKRHRYLSHLPLTCEFKFAELALKPPIVSRETLWKFSEELERRRKHRQRKKNEDKRRSKKIQFEENRKCGLYPEMKISLDNMHQFPAYNPIEDLSSIDVPTVLNIPPQGSPPGVEMEAASSGFSFAKALKEGKQLPVKPPVIEAAAESTKSEINSAIKGDSEESDSEDRVPVPAFAESFSFDIAAALEIHNKVKDSPDASRGCGKKKKQKAKHVLLFNTSMARGKGDTK